MGIDSLRNHSESIPNRSESIPMDTYSRMLLILLQVPSSAVFIMREGNKQRHGNLIHPLTLGVFPIRISLLVCQVNLQYLK